MTIKTELPNAEWLDQEDEDEEDMPTLEHAIICANINRLIGNYLVGKNLGRVMDSTVEYRFLARQKKNLGRYPDVSFIKQERLPKDFRSYPEIAPDLVVEVASPSDKIYDIQAKVRLYQKLGVSLVWIVYPFDRTINVYRLADEPTPQVVNEAGTLDGENVIPGFKLLVSEIFDYPPSPDKLDYENDDTIDII